jgi:hypothetical protein
MLQTDDLGIRKSLCAEHCRYGTRDLAPTEDSVLNFLFGENLNLWDSTLGRCRLSQCDSQVIKYDQLKTIPEALPLIEYEYGKADCDCHHRVIG